MFNQCFDKALLCRRHAYYKWKKCCTIGTKSAPLNPRISQIGGATEVSSYLALSREYKCQTSFPIIFPFLSLWHPCIMSNDSQNGDSPSTSNHHPEYYLNDGNITFIVEDTLFCVHRFFFERESKSFIENLVKAPQDGISDRGPFLLENLTSADFATFLWVWYSPKYRLDKKSKDHWLIILELSTRWQFFDMRKLAIEQLQNFEIDPVEKIAIYDKYKIDGLLLLREYKRLCMREGQMSTEEGETVKLPTVLGIYRARERAIRSAAEKGHHNPAPADVDEEELEHISSTSIYVLALDRHVAPIMKDRRRILTANPKLSIIPRNRVTTESRTAPIGRRVHSL